jgi:hypothetical protein
VREHLLYIGGGWRAGAGGGADATSPVTGQVFARTAVGGRADVDAAVTAAAAAWPDWAAASPFERAEACGLVATAIATHRDELADVLTRDQGKPLAESLDEAGELAVYFRMAGEDAKRLAGELPPSTSADRRILSTRVPLGVVGVISPWNWPYTMGAEILAPAMAAGNTVVWVPAPTTTACCAVLADPGAHWPVQVTQALQGLIHAANTARSHGRAAVPDDIAGPLIHAFRHGVLLGLSQIPRVAGRKQSACRDLLECLRDRHDDVIRFAHDLRIPPTSNQAERDVRPARTQQKISGRLRSADPTRHRYAIRGYISTAAKHGQNTLTAIRDALAGHPWMPPIPDPP